MSQKQLQKCLPSQEPMLKSFASELDALIAKYDHDDGIVGQSEAETQVTQATCEKVKSNAKFVFENEMSSTLRQGMGRALNEFIVTPYQCVCEDFIERSNIEEDLCNERVERAINNM